MVYNAIEQKLAIDRLIDRVKSPRFHDDSYYAAINEAIKKILDDRTENTKRDRKYSAQSTTRLRNELYTLVQPTTPITPAGAIVAFPSDYYYLLSMENTVDGITNVCSSITFNEKGLIERNPFKRSSTVRTYYTENRLGWEIDTPTGSTFSLSEIVYIKMPDTVSIGTDQDKIDSSGTLVAGTTYYVYDEALYNGTTYVEGSTFTATAPLNIVNGTVIDAVNVTNTDMPEHIQDEINSYAAAIMEGTVDDYQKEQNLMNKNELS
jgi:hypothetical protein